MEAEFEGVIHGVLDADKAAEDRAKEKLKPRSVDAYWLQRELNKFFKDPIVSRFSFWLLFDPIFRSECLCICMYNDEAMLAMSSQPTQPGCLAHSTLSVFSIYTS